MATLAVVSPATIIRDAFGQVAQIERVYLSYHNDRDITVLIVINDKDYEVLDRIFDSEAVVLHALPGMSINFDVVIRDGRPLGEVAIPRGRSLFSR